MIHMQLRRGWGDTTTSQHQQQQYQPKLQLNVDLVLARSHKHKNNFWFKKVSYETIQSRFLGTTTKHLALFGKIKMQVRNSS